MVVVMTMVMMIAMMMTMHVMLNGDGDCKHEFYCSPLNLSYIRLYKWVLRSADKENVNDGDHFKPHTHPRR